MPYPDVNDFANWSRGQQMAYLQSTYGSVEDRARAGGQDNVLSTGRFRTQNIPRVASPEEQALWAQVKPDSGTWLGQALGSAAPYALAAGLAAAGGVGAGGFGGGAAGASGAGIGTSAAGLLGGGASMGFWDGLLQALPAVTSLVGSASQSRAAGQAANAQVAGNNAAIAEQRREFDQIQQMLRPQQQLGTNAINTLSNLYGYPQSTAGGGGAIGSSGIGVNGAGGITQGVQAGAQGAGQPQGLGAFTASPDYQFRRDEGNRDLNNSFAARGGALSGNALRGITDYNSNLASGEFNNFVQRQLQMAGLGGAATSQGVNAATNTGGAVSNLLGNSGNARSSGIINQSNAFTNGLNDLSGLFGNWLKKPVSNSGGGSYPTWGS